MTVKALQKQLFAAVAMVLVAVIAVSGSTFAWFSMNTQVSATDMKVVARAESGLLISATKGEGTWSNADASAYNTAVALVPASTKTAADWYHNISSSSSKATGSSYVGTYKTLTSSANSDANIMVAVQDLAADDGVVNVTYADLNSNGSYAQADDTAYFLENQFFIKSSGEQIAIGGGTPNYAKLAIKNVSVTGLSASGDLDKALRIGVKVGSANMVILAPFAGATASYSVNGSTATTAQVGLIAPAVAETPATTEYYANLDTGFTGNIPAVTTDAPVTVSIYTWFEGEDANCKSDNVKAPLDTLNVSVTFVATSTAADYNGTAAAIS